MRIIGLKLRTGEDLIAEYIALYEGKLTVRKPVVPQQIVDNNRQPAMQFYKWPPCSKNEQFTFRLEDYIGEPYDVLKEFEDAYLQITSGIQIATGLR